MSNFFTFKGENSVISPILRISIISITILNKEIFYEKYRYS